jgi:hypothetical protein
MSYLESDRGFESDRAAPAADELLPALAQANQYSMADLDENRDGRISSEQMFKLGGKAAMPLIFSLCALAGWLVLLSVFHLLPYSLVTYARHVVGANMDVKDRFYLLAFASIGVLMVGLAKASGRSFQLILDMAAGRADTLEGRVTPNYEEHDAPAMSRLYGDGEKVWEYHYVIDDQYFDVDKPSYEALAEGTNYRLYFAPHSKLLLSIEPVDSHTAA